ncbi:MAG: tetratricopeptide repeat protein [Ginsengibacter sp.]
MTPPRSRLLFISVVGFFCACQSHDEVSGHERHLNPKEILKQQIKQYPDSLMLVQNLIEIYRHEGAYDSAIALTNSEIARDSGNAYLWNMKATLHFENEDTTNAIKSLEYAVNLYPLPEYLSALGTVYAEVKDPKALIIANELLKTNMMKYGKDAFFIKGLYFNFSGNRAKAINFFDSTLQMDFTYMFAYREKAIALYELGKYEAALITLNRAVTIQNNFDEGYYWMGKCYEKMNMKDEAIQSYQNALLYDKNFFEARTAWERLTNQK